MKLIVNPHKIELIQEQAVNEKEIDISKCEFEFADEITDDYVKEAYFTLGNSTYKKVIVNNKCDFPQEVLVRPATIELGVVAYLVENESEIKRYNPTPVYFKTDLGSLKQAQNSQPITPSELEQYEQALQDGLETVNGKIDDVNTAIAEANNLDLDATKSGTTTTVTLTKKDGTSKQVQILDGEKGETGDRGPQGLQGPTGQTGPAGRDGTNGVDGVSPIATVTKSGSTATITITDKNGTTTTTVSDGTNGTNGRDGYVQYTAGDNITIENNVISASSGSSYTAGEGINIVSDTISSTMPIYKIGTTSYQSAFVIEGQKEGLYIFEDSTPIMKGYNGVNGTYVSICNGFVVLTNTTIDKTSTSWQDVGYVWGSMLNSLNNNVNNFSGKIQVKGNTGAVRVNTSGYTQSVPVAGDTTINGTKTFANLPQCSSTPSSNNQLTNKSYVDSAIASAITTTLGGNY